MQRTQGNEPQPTPAQIGTDEEQTVHRDVPTVAEHNAAMAQRPDDCVGN